MKAVKNKFYAFSSFGWPFKSWNRIFLILKKINTELLKVMDGGGKGRIWSLKSMMREKWHLFLFSMWIV